MKAVARLVEAHHTAAPRDLRCLPAPQWMEFQLAMLAFRDLHRVATTRL